MKEGVKEKVLRILSLTLLAPVILANSASIYSLPILDFTTLIYK
jgi:hypothetical protein